MERFFLQSDPTNKRLWNEFCFRGSSHTFDVRPMETKGWFKENKQQDIISSVKRLKLISHCCMTDYRFYSSKLCFVFAEALTRKSKTISNMGHLH